MLDDSGGPPQRDLWEQYAVDQIERLFIEDEIFHEDTARHALIWTALVLAGIAYAIYEALNSQTGGASGWNVLWMAGGKVAVVALIALWVFCRIQLRRIRNKRRRIELLGLPRI